MYIKIPDISRRCAEHLKEIIIFDNVEILSDDEVIEVETIRAMNEPNPYYEDRI